ncbi:unnamed protein product [Cercospora beticola]|nr:unnamed protein product [Cercospora beticola]
MEMTGKVWMDKDDGVLLMSNVWSENYRRAGCIWLMYLPKHQVPGLQLRLRRFFSTSTRVAAAYRDSYSCHGACAHDVAHFEYLLLTLLSGADTPKVVTSKKSDDAFQVSFSARPIYRRRGRRSLPL